MPTSKAPTNTTTTTKNEPWDAAKPYFNDMYAEANNLRKEGAPNYFPGSTVVDWSQDTKDAYHLQRAISQNPANTAGLSAAQAYNNSVINGTAYSKEPMDTFKNLQKATSPSNATGTLDAAMNFLNQGVGLTKDAMGTIDNSAAKRMQGQEGYTNAAMAGQTGMANKLNGATNEGTQYLRDTADGKYLEAGNPYLTSYIKDVLGPMQEQFKTATAANNSAFAGSGRFGSNAYANARNTTDQTYSDSMAKTATDLAYNNYNAERDRQQQAQNAIGNFYNSDVNNAQNAWNSLAGTSTAQQGLRQDAIGTAGNLQNAYSQLLLGGANQVGNQQVAESNVRTEAANNLIVHDQNDRRIALDAAQAQGNLNLQRQQQKLQAAGQAGTIYDNLFKPVDQLKGVGQAVEQQQGAYLQDAINRHNAAENAKWDNLARQSAILTGGNYSSQSKTEPLYSNNAGQMLGGVGSILGALAMFCDERLKENIQPVGFTKTGVPLYCFTYKDDPESRVHMGPMAQEVAQVHPEAVFQTESGYLAVNTVALTRAQRTTRGNAAVRIY